MLPHMEPITAVGRKIDNSFREVSRSPPSPDPARTDSANAGTSWQKYGFRRNRGESQVRGQQANKTKAKTTPANIPRVYVGSLPRTAPPLTPIRSGFVFLMDGYL